MPPTFKSNRPAIQARLAKNKNTTLKALGQKYGEFAEDELNALVYHQPIAKSGYKRTRRLKSGTAFEVDAAASEVICGNTVEYAIFVEMGTIHMDARPFLQNSILKPEYQKVYRQTIDDMMRTGFA